MTRPLRIEYPGAFYHVINRGNAGKKIFKDRRDENGKIADDKKLMKKTKKIKEQILII